MNLTTNAWAAQTPVPAASPAPGETGTHFGSRIAANAKRALSWRPLSRFGSGRRNPASTAKLFATAAESAPRISLDGSNVLAATGLSRHALHQYVSHHGPFGRDSDLDVVEKTVVTAAIRRRIRSITSPTDDQDIASRREPASRLDALRNFTDAAVCGRGSVSLVEWSRAEAAGLSHAQRCEVLAVVGLVKETIGLHPVPAGANPV